MLKGHMKCYPASLLCRFDVAPSQSTLVCKHAQLFTCFLATKITISCVVSLEPLKIRQTRIWFLRGTLKDRIPSFVPGALPLSRAQLFPGHQLQSQQGQGHHEGHSGVHPFVTNCSVPAWWLPWCCVHNKEPSQWAFSAAQGSPTCTRPKYVWTGREQREPVSFLSAWISRLLSSLRERGAKARFWCPKKNVSTADSCMQTVTVRCDERILKYGSWDYWLWVKPKRSRIKWLSSSNPVHLLLTKQALVVPGTEAGVMYLVKSLII